MTDKNPEATINMDKNKEKYQEFSRTKQKYLLKSITCVCFSIIQEWGDKRTVDDLYSYLGMIDRKRKNFNYFWAAMAELTQVSRLLFFCMTSP